MSLTGVVDGNLTNCGREVANSLLETAVKTAKDQGQMSNQLIVLQAAAIHILASSAFNYSLEGGDPLKFLDSQIKNMKSELFMLQEANKNGEMDKVERPE